MRQVTFEHLGEVLCRAEVADNIWTRGRGLLGRKSLPEGQGLWIVPCTSVHMLFMRFTIDVVFLAEDGRVVKVVPNLRPFRFAGSGRGAHSVLELPAGYLAGRNVKPGDKLAVLPRNEDT